MFGDLFGQDTSRRNRALSAMQERIGTDFERLRAEVGAGYDALRQAFLSERSATMDLLRSEYDSLLSDYDERYRAMRRDFDSGMEAAIGEYRTGRDSTLALIEQDTDAAAARRTAANAFTGVGQTSFGADQVDAIRRQGALQRGAVLEQYGAGLASLLGDAARGRASLDGNALSAAAAIRGERARGVSDAFVRFGSGALGAQEAGLQMRTGIRRDALDRIYQTERDRIGEMRSGTLGSALLGGAIGAVGNMLGGGGG
jgi:hypothetical protein